MKAVYGLLGMMLATGVTVQEMTAQDAGSSHIEPARQKQIFHFVNVTQEHDENEIYGAINRMFPRDMSISLVPTQNAIVVSTTPEQMASVQKLFTELDRPKTAYRITYTVTDSDGGKRIGVQHFALATSSGARTTLKQGSKVPISTGVYDQGHSGTQTQFTYLDVGLNFDTTVDDLAGGVHLKTKLEQSSIAPETSGVGLSDPIVRQSVLEGTSLVTLGKSLTLGSLDVPGSTRHLEVEVVVDQIK